MKQEAPPLLRCKQDAQRRNLVFTSAGEWSNAARWLEGRRNFDVWITYYGDKPGQHLELADFYHVRRDSKFGNLKFVYDTWPHLLAAYQAILVTDDDVLISGEEISRLFDLREELDLWLLQPAFSPLGKISWDITRARWPCRLRFTNFVETTCPLFRREELDAFMRIFDPVLTGTGTDWWFMESLGRDIEGKVAIIDEITCINPMDRTKGAIRECDRLQSEAQRTAAWNMVQAKYAVSRRPQQEFDRMLLPIPARWLRPIAHFPLDLYARARRTAWLASQAITGWLRKR